MTKKDLFRPPRSIAFKTNIRRQLPDDDNIEELLQLHEEKIKAKRDRHLVILQEHAEKAKREN